jgi:hypothetical protein
MTISSTPDRLERLGPDDIGDGDWWDEPAPAPAPVVDPVAAKAGQKGALLAEVRRRLAELEAVLVRAAAITARDHNLPRQGVFADGRLWELKRGQDRKAWDHDSWQADARRQILSGLPEQLVNPDTGEGVDVAELLAAVENVHGAGAPKVGVLKKLGLDPGDYCEQVAGTWGLKVSAPGSADE